MPHGPANAVFVAAPVHIHGPLCSGAGGSTNCDGCPDSMRVMSGSGPRGPIFSGVWQSLQPAIWTMYLPRSIFWAAASFGACRAPVNATSARITMERVMTMRFIVPPSFAGRLRTLDYAAITGAYRGCLLGWRAQVGRARKSLAPLAGRGWP